MQKTYWTLFWLSLIGVIVSVLLIVLLTVLFMKGKADKIRFFVSVSVLLFAIFLCVYLLVPCVKDYSLASRDVFLEDEAVVVGFTHIHQNLDGNGQTQRSQPKFYIESKNEYIILNAANVEIGKRYKITYLPNTKICEAVEMAQQHDTGNGSVCETE